MSTFWGLAFFAYLSLQAHSRQARILLHVFAGHFVPSSSTLESPRCGWPSVITWGMGLSLRIPPSPRTPPPKARPPERQFPFGTTFLLTLKHPINPFFCHPDPPPFTPQFPGIARCPLNRCTGEQSYSLRSPQLLLSCL